MRRGISVGNAAEQWRASGGRRAVGPGRFRRGFGCLAGLVFLIIAVEHLVRRRVGAVAGSGRCPAVLAVVGGIAILRHDRARAARRGALARPHRRGGRPGRGGRLRRPPRRRRVGHAADPVARDRLRHDGRAAGRRRGAAAHAPRRREPRAADAADGHRRQPRGDARRRPPGRRGPPRARSSRRRG